MVLLTLNSSKLLWWAVRNCTGVDREVYRGFHGVFIGEDRECTGDGLG